MKNINIVSLVQAHGSLQEESHTKFLSYYGIKIRDEEARDLALLVSVLTDKTNNKNIFNQFYVGYQIPQIGKEFDLLRLGKDFIINVELKKTSTPEKIQKQLKRNKYYLSFIGRQLHNFCFQADIKELFYLSDIDEFKSVDFSHLIKLLENQQLDNVSDIDNLFNPSDYLVSPFNSTERFIKNEYFLTKQQEAIKSDVLNILEDVKTARFISITGTAGTGKTLLTYDIAKALSAAGKKPLIIHCGILNDGQLQLKDEHGWSVISIRDFLRYELSDYHLVIIDEAQRIKTDQLEKIVEIIQSANGKCIFSYDKSQTLAKWEERRDVEQHINKIGSISTFNLTEKIRTNKEIALFMKALFYSRSDIKQLKKDNIQLNYFNNIDDAKSYLSTIDKLEWEIIHFTPSQYNKEHHENYSDFSQKTSHRVIGQEFENVVITIDSFFYYDENGELSYRAGTYYDAPKMLFQNITRTRKRLNIVIINNSQLLDRCVSLLQN